MEEIKTLEQQAYEFLAQKDYDNSYKAFRQAAEGYEQEKQLSQAALCFASAASSWTLKFGEENFHRAAVCYEKAAFAARKSGDFKYAALLYKHAAVVYERDLEFLDFSECFFKSKECYRKFLIFSFLKPERAYSLTSGEGNKGASGFFKRLVSLVGLSFSSLVWGHGERPARTFFSGFFFVVLAAIFYTQGELIKAGLVFKPDFFEAFYFSVITFTTVGYGDITPIGINKLIVLIEAFSGLFIVPLFIVGLSRKYLRF
ncbi:MAG: ion channel [Candidatus Aceula meridiana]|nr:ion channel [Candidatus Aceula meridiana]